MAERSVGLPSETRFERLDATVANGYHTVTEESLMQYGYNPNDDNQPQVKVMEKSASRGSNGHLVATEVVSGQNADDPLRSRS